MLDYPDIDFLTRPGCAPGNRIQPDIVFNAVAFTAVDKAEEKSKRRVCQCNYTGRDPRDILQTWCAADPLFNGLCFRWKKGDAIQ
jgi:hypothetical protein